MQTPWWQLPLDALAVIVATRPLSEIVPLYRQSGSEENEVVTDRRLRWVGIAACLMLVVGAVVRMAPFTQTDSSTIAESMQPDRIFTSEDEIFRMTDETAPRDIGDIVFRSDFKGG